MSDEDNIVHTKATRVMNGSIIVGLLNIIYDTVVITGFGKDPAPEYVDIARVILGFINSIVFSLSIVIVSLYGSRTLRNNNSPNDDNSYSVFGELLHRYRNSNFKLESLRVLRGIQDLNILETSPLYDVFFRFRKSVLHNLLYRANLSILMNMLLSFFLFYNYIVLLIYYSRIIPTKGIQSQALYLTLNVVNPTVSFVFSYIVILCDNVNSIVVYIDNARHLKELPLDKVNEVIDSMVGFCECVEQPFIYTLKHVP